MVMLTLLLVAEAKIYAQGLGYLGPVNSWRLSTYCVPGTVLRLRALQKHLLPTYLLLYIILQKRKPEFKYLPKVTPPVILPAVMNPVLPGSQRTCFFHYIFQLTQPFVKRGHIREANRKGQRKNNW